MTSKIAVLLVIHLAYNFVQGNASICFFEKENTCHKCMANHTSVPDIVLSGINLTVKVCSREFHLESVLTLANSHSLTVRGMPSKLVCKRFNTGIHIYNVTGLFLQDIEVVSCGHLFSAPSSVQFISSIYIVNCTNVSIERLVVTGSHGNGVTMFDNNETVLIRHSHFKMNRYNRSSSRLRPGGGGLHIVLSYCRPRSIAENYTCSTAFGRDISHSNYQIEHCTFTNNTGGNSALNRVNSPFSEKPQLLASGFGRGGGLCIIIDKNSEFNSVQVKHCRFFGNSALWGGGIYISMLENSHNNTVKVRDCVFHNNSCFQLAGGGADVGFQSSDIYHPHDNFVTFQDCIFSKNIAVVGGGVSFYSSSSTNTMIFVKCSWSNNVADIGAAVNISPQVWKGYVYNLKIRIIFHDCRFTYNYLSNSDPAKQKEYTSYKKGRGIFSAVGYRIWFEGTNVFHGNKNSAMYLTSADIEFSRNSKTIFTNNQGFDGGAIFMLGFSTLYLNDDLNITFANNSALSAGGAIFQHTYDIRDFFASQSCFIKYMGNRLSVDKRNITFLFRDNVASALEKESGELGLYGHSIYTSTIEPCYNSESKGCTRPEYHNQTFDCIGNFSFQGGIDHDLSTSGGRIILREEMISKSNILWIIPGKLTELPIQTLNDFSEEVSCVYHASIASKNKKSKIALDNAYTYLSNKSIKIYGKPSYEADLTLETVDVRAILYTLKIRIQECPPGLIYNKRVKKCECSALTNKQFIGIRECDDDNFQAKLTQGYWVAYSRETKYIYGKEEYLLHALCPLSQCLNAAKGSNFRFLPQTTNISLLDSIVCGQSRTGVLCSKCKEGFASNYHHSTYSCKSVNNNTCKYGWLFYILSEVIPITLFFIVVMVFNIKFTDGAISGFILFVQLSDTMLIKANGFIQLPSYVLVGLDVYRFITRIFNLNFFAIDGLSFCLWKTASTLDLLAFKYITILYASTLVVVIIAIFKYCHNKRFNNFLVKMKVGSAASTKSTIIHGISGFLVICYSECTRISFLLLTPVPLYAGNDESNYVKCIVAFYNGDLLFFRGKHLLYALPALLIVIVLGILPPLMLISYPLCYKVLARLRIEETKFAKLVCKCIPLEKLKPFFDSFQSSYKDEYRFFSGLYFLYRFTTLATFAFVSHLRTYYTFVQIQLAIILAVHALCQPYKKRWHNVLDGFLFLNLSIVNAATLFNFSLTLSLKDSQKYVNRASTVQVLLLYLPLIYVIVYTIGKKFHTVKLAIKALHYKIKIRKHTKASSCEPIAGSVNYLEFSSSFSLNVAEDRLKDNIQF